MKLILNQIYIHVTIHLNSHVNTESIWQSFHMWFDCTKGPSHSEWYATTENINNHNAQYLLYASTNSLASWFLKDASWRQESRSMALLQNQ